MLSQRQQRVLKAAKKDQNFTQTEFPNDERFRFFGYKAVKVEDYDDDYFIRPATNSEKFDLFSIYESDEKLLREIATRDSDSDSDSDSECDRFEDIAEEHSARLFSSKNTHKCKNTSRHAKI